MFRLDYNPITKRWNDRMATLPKEKIELINSSIGKENLLKLKKSKNSVKTGDIFVLSPKEGLYFYGKVLEANIKHDIDDWINGCHVVFIFKTKSKNKDIKEFMADYTCLLCGPDIVTSDYWRKGFFETIGNVPLTNEEKNLDYGFFKKDILGKGGSFKKANGQSINHMPKFFASSGVLVDAGIYMELRTEFIIDPSLLE